MPNLFTTNLSTKIVALAAISMLFSLTVPVLSSASEVAEKKTQTPSMVDSTAASLATAIVEPQALEPQMAPMSLLHDSLWQRLRSGFEFSGTDNRRIDEQIRFLQRGINSLENNLVAASPYLFHIAVELEKARIPLDIALLPLIESAFNPVALSSQSAVGIWQFIPATAQSYGLSTDERYDQRKDVIKSTTAAIRFLTDLHRIFDGDWLLALAAYNTGPGNVRAAMNRAVKQGKEPVYWNLKLSEETSNYIPRLIAATKLISEPAQYGLKLPPLPDRKQIESVAVGRRISIEQVAHLTDLPATKLAELNPGLYQGVTPSTGPHKLTLPVEVVGPLLKQLAHLKRLPLVNKNTDVAALQYTSNQNHSELVIDSEIATHHTSMAASNYMPVKSYRYKTHVVKRGDNLWTISKNMNVDVETLRKWNNLEKGYTNIKVGDKLRVAYLDTANIGPAHAKLMNYLVAPDDTLAKIAQKFDLHIGDIKRWNKSLWGKSYVQPGQILRIPAG